ncbi:Protein N-acetyltransferase, RimJ/RimL family [Kosakonia arachidis]|uniref:Protein N-acetyltransferase, RimJ/RimL family n=1 Tax=Kosakonia arachidis TaxID=551989 RepID=A0A1I6ZEY6_9ENTR|nr:GNAT family protein [Kosakonia arachidis]SFT61101.1 Protein N-acetyltransferase, RimJ/RimL family [Kosakonia arachidis]
MNSKLIEPIVSDLFLLEPLDKSHAHEMYAGLCNDNDYKFIPSHPPVSLDELVARYERISQRLSSEQSEIWLNWVIINRNSGAYLGYVQATIMVDQGWAYIAYHVFSQYQKKGIAKQCVRMLIDFLFNNYNLSHVDALIDTRNLASIGLVESLKLKKINELKEADFFKGSTSDEFHYRVFANEWTLNT